MKKLVLKLDFGAGPIWEEYYDPQTDSSYTGIACVDNDMDIKRLNDKIQDIYKSFYDFDSPNEECVINHDAVFRNKADIILLMAELKEHLSVINDNSFEIDDQATPMLESLQ